ncbi:hypothetical protein J3R82DRAFT_5475 [Butyriboletus roseoflavus]|nr:hypothetical protein J3R82DRAFT_5475 [Butyriboletus roseoflavus]
MGHRLKHRDYYLRYVGAYSNPTSRLNFSGRSFAIGLGPVPFVIIPEVAPFHAVSAISSVGLSVNWILNFFVGLVFLQVRNLLAHGDPMKEGRVFYVFAAALFCSALYFSRLYRG